MLAVSALMLPSPARSQPIADAASVAAEVVMRALGFLGVPYRYGGDDPVRGFDCSGLVRHVFRSALGLDLPRRSHAISEVGEPVPREALAPGDLVFFNTLGRPFSHVALYIGEGRFVHAPAQRGQVRIESLHADYWQMRFDGARRMGRLVASPVPKAPAPVADRTAALSNDPALDLPDFKP